MVTWMTGDMPIGNQGAEPLRRAAGQRHRRLAGAEVDHPHVAPEDAAMKPGAERLGAGLLGGEALGVGGGAHPPPLRFPPLDVGEDAADEALAVALERLLDAPDVDQVAADADDHDAAAFAGSARLVHQARMRPDALLEPDEDRLADQEMADIELRELRNGGDRLDRLVGQAVAGMHLEAERRAVAAPPRAAASGGARVAASSPAIAASQ